MISERDEQQAELLEEYCQALMADPASLPPAGLEPELARATRSLRQQLRAPLPSARFAAALQAQLEEESATPFVSEAEVLPPTKPMPRPVRVARATVGWLAAAALIVLAVAGALYVASDLASRAERQSLPVQPEAHSATEIIARAKAMYQSDAIKSFELTEVFTSTSQIPPRTTQHIFYQTPNHSRIEDSNLVTTIDDGTSVWSYAPPRFTDYGGDVSIYSHYPVSRPLGGTAYNYIESFNNAIYPYADCYHLTLVGRDVVAGRPTYVLDMGAAIPRCGYTTDMYVNSRLWIDHDSFFILKYAPDKNSRWQQASSEVTSIHYNQPLASTLFTFVMPKGVTFTDDRAGNEEQFRNQLAAEINGFSFTTYLAGYLPDKLRPRNLLYNAEGGTLDITYSPYQAYNSQPMPDYSILDLTEPALLRLTMMQATAEAISDTTKGLIEVTINGKKGWASSIDSPGDCNVPGTTPTCPPGGTRVVVVQGETLIEISGTKVSAAEMLKVAASLTPLQPLPPAGPAFPTMPPAPTSPPLPTEPDGSMP